MTEIAGERYGLVLGRALADDYLRSSCRITSASGYTPGDGGGWNPDTDSVDAPCAIQPVTARGTDEAPEGGVAGGVFGWRVYLPAGTPVDVESVVTWLDADPVPRVFRVMHVDGEQTAEPVRRAYCVERTPGPA